MLLKYNIDINNTVILDRIKILINQIYKLLPVRQEGLDWEKPLETIMVQLKGMYELMNCGYQNTFFPLLNKLEGLNSLKEPQDFMLYRRTIFECLNLMDNLKKQICL